LLEKFIMTFTDIVETYNKDEILVLGIDAIYKLTKDFKPVVVFTTVDKFGLTRILAMGKLSDEKQESNRWIIENFNNIGFLRPSFICTLI